MKQLTVLLALIFTTTMMTAQQNPQPTISVKGEGVINVVPDHVIVKVRVEEEGTSAVDVKTKTDASVDNVIKFLRKLKIEDKNIQTNFVRLDKSYNYNTKEYKYSSNQSISIKIEDLEQYDATMSGLLQSGINRIDGIEFGAKNLESLQVEARKKAMLNAKDKAEALRNDSTSSTRAKSLERFGNRLEYLEKVLVKLAGKLEGRWSIRNKD